MNRCGDGVQNSTQKRGIKVITQTPYIFIVLRKDVRMDEALYIASFGRKKKMILSSMKSSILADFLQVKSPLV